MTKTQNIHLIKETKKINTPPPQKKRKLLVDTFLNFISYILRRENLLHYIKKIRKSLHFRMVNFY